MTEEQFLISAKEPTGSQWKTVAWVGSLLLGALLCSLPFRTTPLPRIDAFIPVVDTALFLGDILTATLLFVQAAVLRSRALLALATGYFFTGLIIIPHALTFPGAFAPGGLLQAGVSTTIWIYFFWHAGLPLSVIAYARLGSGRETRPLEQAILPRRMGQCLLVATGLAAVLTLLATLGESWLPPMMADAVQWSHARVSLVAGLLLGLTIVAMLAVWRRRPRSLLDLWILLVLWAWLLELLLVIATSARFSGGWYVGRTIGLLSGVFVLIMLLAETSRIYALLAVSLSARRRDKEGQLLTMNAVAGCIAHELRQPLAAICTNADAGALLLEQHPPQPEKLAEIFQAMADDSLRAARVIDSIRAIFSRRPIQKHRLDVNELLRESTRLVSPELLRAQIALRLELTEDMPCVVADRLQLQHVLLNLFTNAIEAMGGVRDRPRLLAVRSSCPARDHVLIAVSDSGHGIDPATASRIFDPFFTTKAHGNGLGLPLCQSIVDVHEGRLWVAPANPSGATFYVQLPCANAAG